MPKIVTLCLSLLCGLTVTAQDLFNVRVGTFKDVQASDFTNLQPLGFLYGAPGADQVTDVYLGNFTDQDRATTLAADLQRQGFSNAQALALPTATGQAVTVIQIALHSGKQPIDWARLEKAGKLYVEAVNGVTKIMTGIYPSAEVANQFLPAIRQLGFSDAFVKQINNVRLVPVDYFETGIKRPLIPIELQQATTSPAPTVANPTAPAAAPSTYAGTPALPANVAAKTAAPAAASTAALPAPARAPGLPTINGREKRHSSAELQRVLKEKGYYDGSIDGYYGPATARAYEAAWDDLPEIRKYRLLTGGLFAPAADARTTPSDWPEVGVLLRISEDLAAGMANADRARVMVQQRAALFNANAPLAPVAATRARNWASTVWTNLNQWATEDPLHAQMISALRIAYHQSQVRLEDHFMQKKIGPIEARDLATATLQNLVGPQLDRFL